MTHLSTSQRAGQVIIAGFGAGDPPEALRQLATAGALGGFILFRRNLGTPTQVLELTRRLRALAAPGLGLWIAVDQEGGRVARLGPPVVSLPPMRVFGAIDDPSLTQESAFVLGQQLALLGFNLDFAPVLDVLTNPANPAIGDRSFGSEPERVIRHAAAFNAGLARAGVASCGKHFPGHGDTHLDSHHALPTVSHDRQRIEDIELAPFAALAGELPMIITAHVVFEALDPDRPATLSRRIVHDLLRVELGYRGLVVSDDLEMKAVSERYGVPGAACAAVEAGCDTVLVCSKLDEVLATHAALVDRAERDAAFAARLIDASERSIATRARYANPPASALDIERRLSALGAAELEAAIAARSRVQPEAAPT